MTSRTNNDTTHNTRTSRQEDLSLSPQKTSLFMAKLCSQASVL